MQRTAEQQRSWQGAVLLSRGFRPFFLAAAVWAIVAIAIWLPLFKGEIAIPTAFSPIDWHVHEMIFGYGAAVVAGFLLTAIPNWTGRLPVAGWPLAALSGLWVIGRIAVFFSKPIGWLPAAVLDVSFLLAFAALTGREVLAGHNERNFKVVGLVLLLAFGNAAFHVEAALTGSAAIAGRGGLAVIVFLILLIGGRVVPSFTHNWLARRQVAARPASFDKADGAILLISFLALAAWTIAPDQMIVGIVLLAVGCANLWRLARWRFWHTVSDRLVLVLHAGFFFAALGFLFAGAHALWPDFVTGAAGIHVWAVGGIGTMTLAMMTRATLGHTGHNLVASRGTEFVYLAVILAVIARVLMEFLPDLMMPLLYAAVVCWICAFLGFAIVYGPMLARHTPKRH